MEKKHGIFSVHLNFFIVFTMMLHGLGHGFRIDQASSLRALRRAKMQGQVDQAEAEKWGVVGLSLGSEGSFEVGKMEDDVIKAGLLGQPLGVNFKQYAGRNLFYYFAEAVQDPSSKPLLLWLNGGPGCSSLGIGAMVELGPFGVEPDGRTLYSREFAWNKVANTLFLESPAGVGFSYSNTTSDYSTSGDTRTAQDTYTFLVNWFKRYPQYKARDFYIAGESYAGFYIPELSDIIIKKNMEGDSATKIQLKGIMIGNGIMNDDTDLKGSNDYLWSHALISDETYQGLVEHCKNYSSPKCDDYQDRVEKECGKIDFSNIYGPLCSSNSSTKTKSLGGPFINAWKDSPTTMIPIYRRLIASGLRILLYSGDVDAVVPVSGTRYSIDALNLKVIKHWSSWVDDSNEVAGYQVVYDGLAFATIRDAGHEVPKCQPCRALALLKMFIANLY
ncbi:unnamed protein product [Ilex paraguariensis]|uniref:Carboxypeptidase n=1 Tax=Ilex paraguariensis TaxID=185542 RepID=A0ABC8TTY2_9AQUA